MVFEIYWGEDFSKHRGWTMFDIEYYQEESKRVPGKYHSDIHVRPCVEGLFRFFDSIKDNENFNKEEFIKDANEIQTLRGWLFEVASYTIKDKSHYGEKYKYIRNKIYNFVNKYNLYLNID